MSSSGTETSAIRRPKQDLCPDTRSAILNALDQGKLPTKIQSIAPELPGHFSIQVLNSVCS